MFYVLPCWFVSGICVRFSVCAVLFACVLYDLGIRFDFVMFFSSFTLLVLLSSRLCYCLAPLTLFYCTSTVLRVVFLYCLQFTSVVLDLFLVVVCTRAGDVDGCFGPHWRGTFSDEAVRVRCVGEGGCSIGAVVSLQSRLAPEGCF